MELNDQTSRAQASARAVTETARAIREHTAQLLLENQRLRAQRRQLLGARVCQNNNSAVNI